MIGRIQISDKALLKTVNQRIGRMGTSSQSRVTAAVQQGTVTLSGTLRYAIQRNPIVKAVGRITGVRRVIDLLQVIQKKKQ